MKEICSPMRFIAVLLLTFVTSASMAQNGYEIKVTLKPFKNQYIYLGHYYGKQLPIIDSVKLNEKSEGVFKGPKKLGGGIYLIGYPDRAHNFEILIDKNQHFSLLADTSNIQAISFQNSPDNVEFKAYQEFMNRNGREMDALLKQRKSAPADSVRLTTQIDALNTRIKKYRTDLINKDPNRLLAVLLRSMKEPEVPQNDPAAKRDSLFAYHYFKNHYWDGVNFYDDRLARTPFFESRLDRYYEQLVYPAADSVNKEIDNMLGFASINDEMQKFLLLKFVNRYLNQKYMWEDAVFVHLFEKYFAQKNYSWLTDKGKKIITDRAYSLMANIMGNPASEIELPDTAGKKVNLYSVEAPYVLVTIWDPTCSHCKEIVPKLDSMYHAKWKNLGVKLFGMAKETDGTKQDWLSFIQKNKLNDWVHVYYSKESEQARVNSGVPSYSQLYDVQSFPTLYLLDKDKRIIAKKVTFEQVDEILQHRIKNQ
jgi:thiol-disulfide isomerase/thioredoxin